MAFLIERIYKVLNGTVCEEKWRVQPKREHMEQVFGSVHVRAVAMIIEGVDSAFCWPRTGGDTRPLIH